MSNSSYCVAKSEGRLKAAGSGPAEPQHRRRVAAAGAAPRSGQLCGKASPERAGRGGMTAAPPQERNEPPPSTPHTCWHLLPEETAAGGQGGRCRPSLLSSSETKRLRAASATPRGTRRERAERSRNHPPAPRRPSRRCLQTRASFRSAPTRPARPHLARVPPALPRGGDAAAGHHGSERGRG